MAAVARWQNSLFGSGNEQSSSLVCSVWTGDRSFLGSRAWKQCEILVWSFLKDFIYSFLERGEGKERERNGKRKKERETISVWLPLVCPPLGLSLIHISEPTRLS